MLFKKSLSLGHPPFRFGMRLFLVLPPLLLLTSCTTFIPGLDRILYSNSSAEVGPLVTTDEQIPINNEKAEQASSESESSTELNTHSPEPISKTESNQKPDLKPEPAIRTTDSRAASPSKAVQPQTAKVKSIKTPEPDSSNNASSEVVTKSTDSGVPIEYGAVVGKVVLAGEAEQQFAGTGTMITLTPKTMMDEVQDRPPQVHVIDMEDKTYQPRYSTIHAGDRVVFVNKDNIRHNVFSLSENNAFDLGTYGAGLKRAVTLKEPGIVKIYCNIHPEMATFVAVGNQGLSVKADDQGRYQIGKVLPGTYEVTIWNIRGETKRIIEVKANETLELVDRIDTTAFAIEPHKNKFGGNYSKNSKLFEDEFY